MTGWFAQPFRPDGGITAEGLRNQLGRPSLSVLTVLVREAAQNSWDARGPADVDFRLELRSASPAHARSWGELLRPGAPREHGDLGGLTEFLSAPTIRYLAVSDRGTSGLVGPTRSDMAAAPGQRGWLSFVLNSGERQDTIGGGGTYGYGKGAFFLASRVGTVLIYTRFRDESGLVTRLIGASLLTSYDGDSGRPYTGRHWWGTAQEDHCEPLIGGEADAVAAKLGIPRFDGDSTGTTVIVLDPDLRDPRTADEDDVEMSLGEAAHYLAGAAAWNLWPLAVAGRTQRMRVSVNVNGLDVAVPDEDSDAVLANFAEAYRRTLRPESSEPIDCGRPARRLGAASFNHTLGAKYANAAAEELGLEMHTSPHHVALMRRPDLVVQYQAGPAKPHPEAGYIGVFKVHDDLDEVFATSEPPTHDSWVDTQMSGANATFVRVARRRIEERCSALAGPKVQTTKTLATPVGSLSARLGFLLAGVADGAPDGTDASSDGARHGRGSGGGDTRGGSGGAGVRRQGRRPELIGEPTYGEVEGQLVILQAVRRNGVAALGLHAVVVTGEGGLESVAPAASAVPELIGWQLADGSVVRDQVLRTLEDEVVALVAPVEDAVVDISVRSIDLDS